MKTDFNPTGRLYSDDFLMSRKNDYVFKRLFGDARNSHILKSFLNAVISETIEEVTILNPEFRKELFEDRFGILDVKALTNNGTYVDIEIQLNPVIAYDKRILFYWSKLYCEQLKKGMGYDTLEKTISISIVDFEYFRDSIKHHQFFIEDVVHKIRFTDVLEIHFLELKKLKNFPVESFLAGELDLLDEWLYFLQSEDKEVLNLLSKKNKSIKYAYDLVDHMSKRAEDRRVYEAREAAQHMEATAIAGSYKQGFAEGEQAGREEGREAGIEAIVQHALSKGMAIEAIAELTGISEEHIRQIQVHLSQQAKSSK